MPQISASGLANMSGNVSDDGSAVIVGFRNADGEEFKTALNYETLTKCVGFLLGLAEETGQKLAPKAARTETVTSAPLPVAQIGVARGRTETEAILSVRTGILRLDFSTEPATILGMCADIQAQTVAQKQTKPS